MGVKWKAVQKMRKHTIFDLRRLPSSSETGHHVSGSVSIDPFLLADLNPLRYSGSVQKCSEQLSSVSS